MKITQMSDTLANKIAAGEVVERPASVVKELVENSIDAQSTWIRVDVTEAGLGQIKITDNGVGMDEADCRAAFLPHATSKIKDETDLFHVQTLGFRGEALASIAAVSILTIKSSHNNEAGTWLEFEGGKLIHEQKSDARKGTEITVNSLFFNTPARLKYMKSLHTELGHITDLLNRLALSHPHIRFEATHNGKQLFKTTGNGDLLQVISHVYGMGIAKKMLPINHQTLDFELTGYIAKPEITRANRTYISTIINGRFIKSIPLAKAIVNGYHTLLPIGRQPVVILSITMDPILVDVNVHPAKMEVRFSKDKALFQAIEETIRNRFRMSTLIPNIEHQEKKEKPSIQNTMSFSPVKPSISSETEKITAKQVNEPQPAIHVENTPVPNERKPIDMDDVDTVDSMVNMAEKDDVNAESVVLEDVPIHEKKERIPAMYPIGQLQGTYIMAQNENGLYMVDQHAAQERIKYEYFRDKLGTPAKEVQELLLPLTFDFSRQEALLIEQYQEELTKVGLFFEHFGQQTYIIRSYPTWFPDGFVEEVIREMIDQIIAGGKIDIARLRHDAAALMACKRSIKANHYLNHDDMFHLLEELRGTTDPHTCPHGRPIVVHISTYELEKMFKRVM